MTLAPWSTKKSDAAYLRRIRQERKELRERNPALSRRLRKMSDQQLDALELALLLTMPSTPETNYQIRLLTNIQYHRDHLQRKLQEQPSPPLSPVEAIPPVVPTEMDGDTVFRPGPYPTSPPPPATPTERLPDNVIPFDLRCVPKAFGVGRDVRWVGGETPQFPGDYGK